jgi:Uma2 family endonuclease
MRDEVTTVTSPYKHQPRVATLDDWERLEPAEGRRVELVDGHFRVNAAPVPWHQKIADRLGRVLDPVVDPLGWDVLTAVGVRMRRGLGYIPDLVICERVARGAKTIAASTVVLAVEVVSPSSRRIDRFEKPDAHAAAGIQAYWRAEIVKDRLTGIHCYRLRERHYAGDVAIEPGKPQLVTLPFGAEITIDIDTLDRD